MSIRYYNPPSANGSLMILFIKCQNGFAKPRHPMNVLPSSLITGSATSMMRLISYPAFAAAEAYSADTIWILPSSGNGSQLMISLSKQGMPSTGSAPVVLILALSTPADGITIDGSVPTGPCICVCQNRT